MGHRRYHLLRPNKSTVRPIAHLFVDVESRLVPVTDRQTNHVLWFGWTCFWERRPTKASDTVIYWRFATIEDFWDIVERRTYRKRPLYLVSHNVNYDFGVLDAFGNLEQRGYTLTQIYLAGMTAIMSFTKGDHKIILLDNSNYFQGTLASLGLALGYPKLDVDPLTATEQEADPYCKRDVEILLKAWQTYYEFLDTHDLGKWGKTLPSQAFNAYRHRFMPKAIHIHDQDETLAIERKAYHGGRTSIFFKGTLSDGPYYYLDVNSMYPYVMEKYSYPRIVHTTKEHATKRQLAQWLKTYLCVADVTVNTDERVYQVRIKNHAVHPIGQFRVTLTTPELKYALRKGHIITVHKVVRYDHAPLFRDYVRFFYALKTQYKGDNQTAFYLMVKLFLNSLYGKFGQRAKSMVQIEDDYPDIDKIEKIVDSDTGDIRYVYRFGSTFWYQEDRGEAYNSFPAIAAHVTAYARMYLWELMQQAGDGHYYYCDTDSLIVDSVGYERLQAYLDDTRLGALKVERTSDTCTLRAPKCYTFGDITRRKGVPRKALKTGDNSWSFESFPSFRRQCRWAKGTPFHTTSTSRTLSHKIYDGQETDSGWIKPFDALDLEQSEPIPQEALVRVSQIETEVDMLRQSVKVDAATVFTIWNHKQGGWRTARDRQGNIVPLEYSNWDSKATELGFPDLTALQEETVRTLQTWAKIRDLEEKAYRLTHPSLSLQSQEAIPF